LIGVVVTVGLLAALVWAMSPAKPPLTPAPLRPLQPGCPKVRASFTPSNYTEIPKLSFEGFSSRQKNRALLRLNMEVCPCGCNTSIAECLNEHPPCEACKALARKILDEEKAAP
jgi:hypothetical protein